MNSARTYTAPGIGDSIVWSDRPTQGGAGMDAAHLRKIIQDELARERGLKSFAGASEMMSIRELGAFLGMKRTAIYEHRIRRDRADPMRKDAEFPQEYLVGKGRRPHFKKSEVEKWQSRNMR